MAFSVGNPWFCREPALARGVVTQMWTYWDGEVLEDPSNGVKRRKNPPI
jgi:hypothetical protein